MRTKESQSSTVFYSPVVSCRPLGISNITVRLAILILFILCTSSCTDHDKTTDFSSSDLQELKIVNRGGMMYYPNTVLQLPHFVLGDNGRLVFPDSPKYSSRPAIRPVFQIQIDDNQMNEVLLIVQEMGLPNITKESYEWEFESQVMDAGVTSVIMNDIRGTHTYSVYAMHYVAANSKNPRVASFNALLELLESFASPESRENYVPEQIEVYESARNNPPGTEPPTATNDHLWPLPENPPPSPKEGESQAQCYAYSGDEAATLFASLESASQETQWLVNGEFRRLFFRPLFPGEIACSRH